MAASRGTELAQVALIDRVRAHGRMIIIASTGSSEASYLDFMGAHANAGGERLRHIILRPDARKLEGLEEFLHGTQHAIGIIAGSNDIRRAELHVKRFMNRHRDLLRICPEDVDVLEAMIGESK